MEPLKKLKENLKKPLRKLRNQVTSRLPCPQYYSRAVSPYGTFIVCTDRPVQAAWQQYRPIIPVSSAETASYKTRRV